MVKILYNTLLRKLYCLNFWMLYSNIEKSIIFSINVSSIILQDLSLTRKGTIPFFSFLFTLLTRKYPFLHYLKSFKHLYFMTYLTIAIILSSFNLSIRMLINSFLPVLVLLVLVLVLLLLLLLLLLGHLFLLTFIHDH